MADPHRNETTPVRPTAGYPNYAFRYGEGLAWFVADRQVMETWKTGLSKRYMHRYTNPCFPGWLNSERPLRDSCLYVDWTRCAN